jgi:hypothetical protein
MSEWKQPAPTRRFAVWFEGAWYGQGETVTAAWFDARRQTNADHCRYGATLFRKLRERATVNDSMAGAAP